MDIARSVLAHLHVEARAGRLLVAVLAILAAAPAVYLAHTVTTHWVNVPHMDQWDISHVFIWHHSHQLTFEKLISQHNESRKLFPRLIFLGMGLVSGWDVRWEMVLSMIAAATTSVNLLFLLRGLGSGLWWRMSAWLLMNLVLFSPVQWDNWLWGIQLVAFIPPLMLTLGLVAASSGPLWRQAMVRSGLAFIATFSYANGMLLWALLLPAGFLVLSPRGRAERDHRWFAILWYVVSAATTLWLYFHDYHKAPGKPASDLALSQPLEALRYYLAWIGSTLVPEGSPLSLKTRIVVGGSILAVFLTELMVVAARACRDSLRRNLPWVILGLYALISGAATTFGRLGFGIQHAADSRYTTFSLYLLLAAIGLAAAILPGLLRARGLRACLAGGIAAGVVVAFLILHVNAVKTSQWVLARFSECIDEGRLGLHLHKVLYDETRIRYLYPNVRFVLIRADELAGMGLLGTPLPDPGPFWQRRRRGDAGEEAWGFLDSCRPTDPTRLAFSGWVRNPREGGPGDNVVLVWTDAAGNSAAFAVQRISERMPHIAALMHEPALTRCGFRGTVEMNRLPLGELEISAWTVDSGTEQAHQLAHPIVIVNSSEPPTER